MHDCLNSHELRLIGNEGTPCGLLYIVTGHCSLGVDTIGPCSLGVDTRVLGVDTCGVIGICDICGV